MIVCDWCAPEGRFTDTTSRFTVLSTLQRDAEKAIAKGQLCAAHTRELVDYVNGRAGRKGEGE